MKLEKKDLFCQENYLSEVMKFLLEKCFILVTLSAMNE